MREWRKLYEKQIDRHAIANIPYDNFGNKNFNFVKEKRNVQNKKKTFRRRRDVSKSLTLCWNARQKIKKKKK